MVRDGPGTNTSRWCGRIRLGVLQPAMTSLSTVGVCACAPRLYVGASHVARTGRSLGSTRSPCGRLPLFPLARAQGWMCGRTLLIGRMIGSCEALPTITTDRRRGKRLVLTQWRQKAAGGRQLRKMGRETGGPTAKSTKTMARGRFCRRLRRRPPCLEHNNNTTPLRGPCPTRGCERGKRRCLVGRATRMTSHREGEGGANDDKCPRSSRWS